MAVKKCLSELGECADELAIMANPDKDDLIKRDSKKSVNLCVVKFCGKKL